MIHDNPPIVVKFAKRERDYRNNHEENIKINILNKFIVASSLCLGSRLDSDELLCAYTNLPKNTLTFVNLGKILETLFGENLEFTLAQSIPIYNPIKDNDLSPANYFYKT